MRFAVVLCLLVGVASAEAPSPTSEAERLFQEGLALFETGKFDEACAKFDQSIKKNPRALGTLMNLGRCNERRGKIATALALYQEAFDRASESGAAGARDTAQERIAVLSGQVPVVVLQRKGPPLPGEKLFVDDKVVPLEKSELQLDPGTHTFVLSAPGRLQFQKPIHLKATEKVTLELPVLELPKERTVVKRVGSTKRTLGKAFVIGGSSLAAIAAGFVLYAKRDYDKQFEGSNPHCSGPTIDGLALCDDIGQARTERDRSIVTGASVIGAVGLAAVAGGLVMWLTADERTAVVPTTTATSGGITLIRRF